MEIKINDKNIELHFGWGFLSYVNKNNGVVMEGVNSGVGGMALLNAGVAMKDPETLLLILQAGTVTERTAPQVGDLQVFIETLIENGEYGSFFDEVAEEMGKNSLLRQAMNGNQAIEKATRKKKAK